MKSMTGYGCAERTDEESLDRIKIEVSGVNRKQLDVRVSLPRDLTMFESLTRVSAARHLSRGTLTVRAELTLSQAHLSGSVHVNEAVAEKLYVQLKALQTKLGLAGQISVGDMMLLPGVVTEDLSAAENDRLEQLYTQTLEAALTVFDAMREKEGAALKKDFLHRFETLEKILDTIENVVKNLADDLKTKICEKAAELKLELMADPERLDRELFYYCQKADVTEELTRLRSHFVQARALLNEPQPGRSLDFLAQEMLREITTLGNKVAHVELSPLIVAYKTEIDRIKEQIQNIE